MSTSTLTRPDEDGLGVDNWRYPYDPRRNPRQTALHQCDAQEILFGGAAGPGKTDALIACGVIFCLLIPGAKVYLFRRTFKQLELEIIPRMRARIPERIAHYNGSEHTFTFGNGSVFRLAYLASDKDLLNYQGAEIHLALFDELTQFARYQYTYIRSRLRAAGDVAAAMQARGLVPRIVSSSNPTGPGHGWCKRMFVDPSIGLPQDEVFEGGIEEGEPLDGLRTMAYIPARAHDNPFLDEEAYARQLAGLDPILRRALEDGDWTVLQGVRFSQFRSYRHVIEPEQLPVPPIGYPRAVGVDWGIAAPFAAVWGALVGETVVIYREIGGPDYTADQQVRMILEAEDPGEREPGRPIPVALDPSCWARGANSPLARKGIGGLDLPAEGSVAWYYRKALGGSLVKAWNDRVGGAQLLDHHLLVTASGLPRILIYRTCPNLIRTIPDLLRGDRNPEDVGTRPKQDDHWYDALRYLLGELVRGGHPRTPDELPAAAEIAEAEEDVDDRYDTLLARHRTTLPRSRPAGPVDPWGRGLGDFTS